MSLSSLSDSEQTRSFEQDRSSILDVDVDVDETCLSGECPLIVEGCMGFKGPFQGNPLVPRAPGALWSQWRSLSFCFAGVSREAKVPSGIDVKPK